MEIDELDILEITELIDWLSKFGEDSKGGITRLLYTEEWINAQRQLKQLMEEKGFRTYFDEIGNLFCRLDGSKYKDETILTGSHIDSVVRGGRFDGQLGVLGGLVAIDYLKRRYGQPLRNIEVVSIAEEEGSRFPYPFWGSKNIVDCVSEKEVEGLVDVKNISLIDAMRKAGFDFKDNLNKRNDIRAFIELHVEQGGVLDVEGKSIGIVEYIVGQRRFTIEVDGQANHAGTTPMSYRKDALYATSKIINNIIDKAIIKGEPLVATVGRLEVVPNTVNVVPGKTLFSLDVRHISKDSLNDFTDEVNEIVDNVSKEMGVKIKVDMYMNEDPVAMDRELVSIIKSQCEGNGLNYKLMHSGAGHDSQIFAQYVSTAMIFVPSYKGISHNPEEFTEIKDVIEGIKALTETLYTLAYR